MKTIKNFMAKSLTGIGLLVILLMSYSCTQESISTDFGDEPEIYSGSDINTAYAKGKKARPIKGNISFVLDTSNGPVLQCGPIPFFPGLVNGNLSHLGKLQPGQSPDGEEPISGSYVIPESCDISGFPEVIVEYSGVFVAANGDQLWARNETTLTFDLPFPTDAPPSGTATGTGTYDGGDGRFDGASGTFMFNGSFGGGVVQVISEGEITY